MKTSRTTVVVWTVGLAALAPLSQAGIGVLSLGMGAPPANVPAGDALGLPVTSAPLDSRPLFEDVTAVSFSPTAGVAFNHPLAHRRVGEGWATWSHGYLGDVYRNYSSEREDQVMTLVSAVGFDYFAFYAEPGPFSVFDIRVTGVDHTGATISLTQPVNGEAGATGWGFYATGGARITSITSDSDAGFAVGEFTYHEIIPAPGTLAVAGLAGAGLVRRRR